MTGEGFLITRRGILLWSRNLTSSWRIGLWDTWKIASLGNISRRSSGAGGTSPSGDPRMRGKRFTASTFTERNSILVSLRATNPTLQQARQASQIAVGRSTLTVGNSPQVFAPGDNHPRTFLGTSPHPNRVCGLVHSAAFLGVPLGEGLLSGIRPEVTGSGVGEECVILLVFVTGKAPGA